MRRYRMLIAGEWVDAAAGEVFETPDPFTGEPWALIPRGRAGEARRAVTAAAAAFLGGQADAPGAPWFWSDRYDAHVEAVGDMTVPAGGRIVDREVRGVVVASFALAADGTLRGAASIDDPMTVKAARRIIDRGIVVDAAALADPAVPVKSLARG